MTKSATLFVRPTIFLCGLFTVVQALAQIPPAPAPTVTEIHAELSLRNFATRLCSLGGVAVTGGISAIGAISSTVVFERNRFAPISTGAQYAAAKRGQKIASAMLLGSLPFVLTSLLSCLKSSELSVSRMESSLSRFCRGHACSLSRDSSGLRLRFPAYFVNNLPLEIDVYSSYADAAVMTRGLSSAQLDSAMPLLEEIRGSLARAGAKHVPTVKGAGPWRMEPEAYRILPSDSAIVRRNLLVDWVNQMQGPWNLWGATLDQGSERARARAAEEFGVWLLTADFAAESDVHPANSFTGWRYLERFRTRELDASQVVVLQRFLDGRAAHLRSLAPDTVLQLLPTRSQPIARAAIVRDFVTDCLAYGSPVADCLKLIGPADRRLVPHSVTESCAGHMAAIL